MAGGFAFILYMIWPPIREWNNFIYAESLFTSFCIFSFTLLLLSKTFWQYSLAALVLLFTFFIRPTGFCLVVGVIGYGIAMLPRTSYKFALPVMCVMAFIAWSIANKMFKSYDQVEGYVMAEIIYPKITLGITPPASLTIPDTGTPLEKVFLFALNNPLYFLKLVLIKISLFYGNIKPYYSTFHNTAIVLFLYPLYYLSIRGITRLAGFKKERFFIASFIIANGTIVGLTTENWDGRFLVPVLPFIFMMASPMATQKLVSAFLAIKEKVTGDRVS
jgi:hypothetical protein